MIHHDDEIETVEANLKGSSRWRPSTAQSDLLSLKTEEDRCAVCHRTVMFVCHFLCRRTAFDNIFSQGKNCDDMSHNLYPFYVKTSWKHVQMLRLFL